MLNCVIVDIILLGHQCTDHEGEGLYDYLLTILPIPYDFFRDPISSLLNCECLSRFLDVKALVGAFNQEKALAGAALQLSRTWTRTCIVPRYGYGTLSTPTYSGIVT